MSTTRAWPQRFRQSALLEIVGVAFSIAALWTLCAPVPAHAGLNEGIEAYDNENYRRAFDELLPLAKQGNAKAQQLIGLLYRFGQGTSIDLQQWVKWTTQAADQGDSTAQADLGIFLLGITKDSTPGTLDKNQGWTWLTKAAQAGNAKAQYVLGLIYLDDIKGISGFPTDTTRGIQLLSESGTSSDKGYRTESASMLVIIYSGPYAVSSEKYRSYYDFDKALHWLDVKLDLSDTRKAAEAGDKKAALDLAYALSKHGWSPHDAKLKSEIMKWYGQAASAGVLNGKAAEDYGCMYVYGNGGIPKDFDKARHWVEVGKDASTLESAAAAGDAKAMAALGDIYSATCLKADDTAAKEARKWYEKAVASGYTAAAWNLYDSATTEQEEKRWAEIAADITTLDGKPINTRYGGATLFENLPRRDIPWNFRHAPGKSYLTLHSVSVYAQPNPYSPVNAEIGRFRHVYARPSGTQGWVALIAAGKGQYPDPFQYLSPSRVEDGKFVPRRRMNRQFFDPYVGYVREELLGSLDDTPPLPLPTRGLVPAPAYWAAIGIEESRRFVTDLNQHPYDALVRVATKKGSCSGAIVLKPTVVVTAGHCFDTGADEAHVIVERGPAQIEKIPARIVQRELSQRRHDDSKDWAVLRLERAPRLPVTPLYFADGMDWSHTTRFWGVVAGYPGDLFDISRKQLGFSAPSLSQCLIDVARHTATANAVEIRHSCNQWFGVSGGPLLVWNPDSMRFEVLALNTFGSEGFTGFEAEFKALFAEEIFKSQARIVLQQFDMKDEPISLDEKKGSHARVPGLSSVHIAYQSWTNSAYSAVSTLSTKMIEVVRKTAGITPPASPYLKDPKRLGFWFSDEDEWSSVLPTAMARAACAQQCDEIIVRPQGWTLQLGQKVNWEELARRDDTLANKNAGSMVVGGDLFYIDNESRVTGVVRRFMNLKEYGSGFNRQFELWQQYKHLSDEYSDSFIWNEESHSEVKPTTELRADNFGGDTPMDIPGAKVIKVDALAQKLAAANPPLVVSSIHSIWGPPGSIDLSYSSNGGTYADKFQQRLQEDLGKLARGDKSREIVFYCHHAKCWLSYNSALRAIQLGYTNVYWFRGGLNTWAAQGLPMELVKKGSD